MNWIDSNGGPLIFSSKKYAKDWKGTTGSSLNLKETDYERACATSDYMEIIPSGGYELLVLGDEPMASTLCSSEKFNSIARWEYCESQEMAINALKNLPTNLNGIADDKFIKLPEDELIIFDSALSFYEIDGGEYPSMEKGVYRITTEIYKSEKEFSFVVHRLIQSA